MMMKMYVLLALLGVLFYHSTIVGGSCVSCGYQKSRPDCKDPYDPPGPEKDVCKGAIIGDLCRKYKGGYTIYCETMGSTVTCSKTQSPCPSGAGLSKPLYIAVVLMSVFAAMVTRF